MNQVLSPMFSGQIKFRHYGENAAKISVDQIMDLQTQARGAEADTTLMYIPDWARGMNFVYAPENKDKNKVATFTFQQEATGDLLAKELEAKGVQFDRTT